MKTNKELVMDHDNNNYRKSTKAFWRFADGLVKSHDEIGLKHYSIVMEIVFLITQVR